MNKQREHYERWYAKLKADPERWAEFSLKQKERFRKWREDNPGKGAEVRRKWREDNQEKRRDDFRKWEEANSDKRKEYIRQYHVDNREARNEKARNWRFSNLEEVRKYHREYSKANLGKFRENSRRHRALKANTQGSHTEAEWQALCSYYMDQCLACGEVPDTLTRDHVVPLAKGGCDDISNIQPLCKPCNSSKSTKTIDYRI